MKPILLCSVVLLLASAPCFSQEDITDSSKTLNEVTVKAYEQNRKLIEVAAPVSFTGQSRLKRFGNVSILPAVNMTPGVRMEERSPGSYRLNIRGSSLRSPFGVRDVKIYINDIPLTDPSGNTYLNQLSYYNFNSIEIIKGPASSLYGAGIGGAMLIHTLPATWCQGASLDYSMGSFNNYNINVNVKAGNEDHQNSFNYSHQTSDGYRVQTKMRKDIVTWESQLKITDKQTLHAFMSYSDLYYQTPGALTLAQYNANPRQARPKAGTQPSAVDAKAAIFQKTFIAGFSNDYDFNEHWQNTTSVYGSYTDFRNPGIRAYEYRKEPHFGGRSVFTFKKQMGTTALQLNAGIEAQKGFFNTKDYTNKSGVSDSLLTDDNINLWQYLIFAQVDLKLSHGFIVTAGVSFNKSEMQFVNLVSRPSTTQTRTFKSEFPPHLGILKKITGDVSVYASAAKGFSTPTSSELRPAVGLFGINLQPQDGMDYELGLRGNLIHGKLCFDASGFLFHVNNTIVQRIDNLGNYYYLNAGSTKQNGVEYYLSYQLADHPDHFITSAKLWVSHAFHDFHYDEFIQQTKDGAGNIITLDSSGNKLPGVPRNTVVSGLDVSCKAGLYLNFTYNYTDPVYLNDGNTEHASPFNLIGLRLGYRKDFRKKIRMELFAGGDNLTNVTYSLGNDINAAVGRYYNAAPGRNYYAGVSLQWIKAPKN